MSRKWREEAIIWSILLLLGAAVSVKVLGEDAPVKDADAAAEIAEIQEQCLVRNNEMRAARGLRPHKANASLNAAAQDHAQFMARESSFGRYSNGGPSGRAAKYGFGAGVRENIGRGYQTVSAAFNGWRNSGAHYAAMLSATTDAGFGLAYSRGGTPYWCAVYGTPPSPESKPSAPPDALPSQSQSSPSGTNGRRIGLIGWIFGKRKT